MLLFFLIDNTQTYTGVTAKSPRIRRSCSKISSKGFICSTFIVTIVLMMFLIGFSYVKYSQRNSNFTVSDFVTNLIAVQPHHLKSDYHEMPKRLDFVGKDLPLMNVSWPLPSRPNPFVGRKKLINEIMKNLLDSRIHIVGLFGPPAFGKSSLAIYIGHEILNEKGIKVNYVDLSEFQLSFDQKFQFNIYTKEIQIQDHCKNLEKFLKRSVNVDNLLKWAVSIEHTSVLVLDNCDLVLNYWHDDFQDFLLELFKYSKENLKVIITSQRKISFANHFIAVEVTEFNEEESLSLIRVLQPQLSYHIQNEIAELVGNCPLAIKVALVLLQTIDSNTLISDLKTNGIQALSSSSFPKKERFDVVMETACKYLDNTTKKAAYFFSFFPGSFSKDVLSFSTFKFFHKNVNILFERSLLERYTVAPASEVRYKFHKLIKQYFSQKILTENSSREKWRSVFRKVFADYYTRKFFWHFISSNSSLSQKNKLFLTNEQNNLRYLTSNIVPKSGNFSSEEKIVVVFAYLQGVMQSNHSNTILDMVLELVEDNTTKFSEICFSDNNANMCKDLVFHLIHSAAVATDTSYAHLPCNIWEKITYEKWNLVTDVSVQTLFDKSQLYCLQIFYINNVKYFVILGYYLPALFMYFHYYKVLLRASTGCEPTYGPYLGYLILPCITYKLMECPVLLISLLPLFLWVVSRYTWNTCIIVFLLYLCLFYFNCLWLIKIGAVVSYFLLDENGPIVSKVWCHLCVQFTPTNSYWIFHTVNNIICAVIISHIPIANLINN